MMLMMSESAQITELDWQLISAISRTCGRPVAMSSLALSQPAGAQSVNRTGAPHQERRVSPGMSSKARSKLRTRLIPWRCMIAAWIASRDWRAGVPRSRRAC